MACGNGLKVYKIFCTDLATNLVNSEKIVESFMKNKYFSLIEILGLCIVLIGCSNPDKEFKSAFKANQIAGYEQVIKKFPDDSRIADARRALYILLGRETAKSNDIVKLKLIIKKYPKTTFALKAKKRIINLELLVAIKSTELSVVKKFIVDYPNSRYKKIITAKVASLKSIAFSQKITSISVEDFKKLIDVSSDLNDIKRFNETYLHMVARVCNAEVAQFLLDKKIKVNTLDTDGATALHRSAKSNCTEVAKLIIAKGANLEITVASGGSVIKFGKAGSATLSSTGPSAMRGTALHWAARHNRPEMVKLLLASKAKVNSNGKGLLPIHYAAKSGNLSIVKQLVEAGANWKNMELKKSPLAYSKTIEVAKYFIAKGERIDKQGWGIGKPIHQAAILGHVEVVLYLVDQGAKINGMATFGVGPLKRADVSAMWVAVAYKQFAVVKALHVKGADIHQVSKDGGGLIHAAAKGGNIDILNYLIKAGVKINVLSAFPSPTPFLADWNGISPLGVAIEYKRPEIVTVLIKAGADVNQEFTNKWNPLITAILNRDINVVTNLLDNKANLGSHKRLKNWNTTSEINALIVAKFGLPDSKKK